VILFDTSAIYALASARDSEHEPACRTLERIRRDGEELVLHTYILVEAFALIHRRRGLPAALRMAADTSALETVTVDRALHDRAVAWLAKNRARKVSLVDAVSFLVMRDRGIESAFAYDPDFEKAGFRLLRAE
jgi:uncharacterized protein